MVTLQRFIEKNAAFIQLIAGMFATLITLTAFAYSTFVTKEQLKDNESRLKEFQDYRLDRLEKKLDQIDVKLDSIMERGGNK